MIPAARRTAAPAAHRTAAPAAHRTAAPAARRTAAPLIPAARSEAIGEGAMLRVVLEGRPILLARVEGRVLACDDGCTHDRASLAAGWLEGHRVECPRHGALFDLRDGRAVALPATVGVGTYRVHEQDGEIRVQLHGTGQVNESESER